MPLPPNMNSDEFYRQRDARTTAAVRKSSQAETIVAVSVERAEAETSAGQAAFLLAVNLISRWCRRVEILAPDVPVAGDSFFLGNGSLRGTALSVAHAADPFGHFETTTLPNQDALKLHVGRRPPPGAFPILGRGWLALAGADALEAPTPTDSGTALGALLAACVGVSWVFRKALNHRSPPCRSRLSLWNLRGAGNALQGPKSLAAPNLGRVLLVGAGAVGSGIAFFLPTIRAASEEIVVVDGDCVEISNLNRTPLFFADHVGLPKALAAAQHLRDAGYRVSPIERWFDEAVKEKAVAVKGYDLVVPAADERGVRHTIQHQIPPLQIYATTGSNWHVFLGRHIPLKEDCLACRFPGPETRPKFACGEGRLDEQEQEPELSSVVGSLPFASAAAAILACAEVAKLAHPGYPINRNFACLGFRGALEDFLTVQEKAAAHCRLCPDRDVWSRLNRHSRYASLSFPG